MSAKRLTPSSKRDHQEVPGGSTFRTSTPTGRQNATFVEPRIVRTCNKKLTSTPSQTLLDVSGVSVLSGTRPKLFLNRTSAPPEVDRELECDLAYAGYLQAMMKKEIVSNSVQQHREDLSGQLYIQKDNLHKSKLKLRQTQKELMEMEQMEKYNEILEELEKHANQSMQLFDNLELATTLKQLISMLNWNCNKMVTQNVQAITNPEDFVQLELVLKKCATQADGIINNERNKEAIEALAVSMIKCKEVIADIKQKQLGIDNMQKLETYKLFKSISDSYTKL